MNLDAVWHNFWDENLYIFWICLHDLALFVIRFLNLFLNKLTLHILCYMITNPFILNSTFDQNSSFLREHGLSVYIVSSYRMKHRICYACAIMI